MKLSIIVKMMIRTNRLLVVFFFLMAAGSKVRAQDTNYVLLQRMVEIKSVFDSALFVNRFQSVETPCLCIDEKNDSIATPKRRFTNSNYRIQLKKADTIDTNGVKCLSEYCSRYLRFHITGTDLNQSTMEGTIESSYSYPASSLIQYLGFTNGAVNNTTVFFERLLRSKGTFSMYPEDDKYRIKLALTNGPYDKGDTVFGYLEIVREGFRSLAKTYILYFDQMSIRKGDRNNQIFIKFSSTSHHAESEYHSILAYNVLKKIDSPDKVERASAIWLQNFLKNPRCPQCGAIYNSAANRVRNKGFALPNTEPIPAH